VDPLRDVVSLQNDFWDTVADITGLSGVVTVDFAGWAPSLARYLIRKSQ
jgi:hypothetical protein